MNKQIVVSGIILFLFLGLCFYNIAYASELIEQVQEEQNKAQIEAEASDRILTVPLGAQLNQDSSEDISSEQGQTSIQENATALAQGLTDSGKSVEEIQTCLKSMGFADLTVDIALTRVETASQATETSTNPSEDISFQAQGDPQLVMVKDGVHYTQDENNNWVAMDPQPQPTLVAVVNGQEYIKDDEGNAIPLHDLCPTSVVYSQEIGITIYDSDFQTNEIVIQGEMLDYMLSCYEGNTQQEQFDNFMEANPDIFTEIANLKDIDFQEDYPSEELGDVIAFLTTVPKSYLGWIKYNDNGNGWTLPSVPEGNGPTLIKVENDRSYMKIETWDSKYDHWVPLDDTAATSVEYSPEEGITLFDPDFSMNYHFSDFEVKIKGEALTMLLSSYEGDTEQEKFESLMSENPTFFDDMLKALSVLQPISDKIKFKDQEGGSVEVMEKRLGTELAIMACMPEGIPTEISFYHGELWLQGNFDD